MTDDLDMISFRIIADASDAKDLALDAFKEAMCANYAKSDELLAKSRSTLEKARRAQTDVLFDEMNGKTNTVNVLLVHSQDHLTAAQTTLAMVENLMPLVMAQYELKEKVEKLEGRIDHEN
ncbi:PTS lactose/cellobiose transporter subunit IIA [Allobaculum mucilyticum]|uniref:PTS lactose/cellobiose transporter subunit IIA n=1 Tax=Allobaculum mucilyticum TaxID=2834459 RepID=UPI001E4DB34C|nr:PTS lactose/cellobiose transporter subunit IIA [Allobaculum mucilyticum]UNT96997.1 PTS lactose/cellobiose transporter subunit IIA [Allobaculum mucilyticum]